MICLKKIRINIKSKRNELESQKKTNRFSKNLGLE